MSWSRIRGHKEVIQSFQLAWKRGRLGHAYLFVGMPGIGKRTFAVELARALLCEQPRTNLEACDACESCRLVDAGTHPDLFRLERPEGNLELPIEIVRELTNNLSLKPARGGRKIGILDDAGYLNDASANCFLKTLEEPPPESVLILIGSASADQQIATIVSRCQVIHFRPLPKETVRTILTEHAVTDPQEQHRLLRFAEGSPGQALQLRDEGLWQFRQLLCNSFTAEAFPSVLLAREWMRWLEDHGKDASDHRRWSSLMIRLLLGILKDTITVALGVRAEDDSEVAQLQKIAKTWGIEKLLEAMDRALDAEFQIDRKVQLILVIEGLFDHLARLSRLDPVSSRARTR